MTYHYTVKADPKTTAIGVGRDLPISPKQSTQIASAIRGKKVEWVKKFLEDVIAQRQAVKMKRFNKDIGHKKGIGPGRYPVKACTAILALIKSVETNAQYKGLGGDLVLETIVSHKGAGQWHYGRQRRRQMKRTTVEVVLKEVASKKTGKDKIKTETKAVKTGEKKSTAEAKVKQETEIPTKVTKAEETTKEQTKVAAVEEKKTNVEKAELKPAVKVEEKTEQKAVPKIKEEAKTPVKAEETIVKKEGTKDQEIEKKSETSEPRKEESTSENKTPKAE